MDKEEESKSQVDDKSPSQLDEHISTQLAKHNVATAIEHKFNALNLFDPKQLAAAENFLTKIMRSKKGGIENVNDGLAILMRTQDLGLPFSSCIEHIHVINGKTGIDIHIVKALLSRVGVTWRCLLDYAPLYEYTDGCSAFIDNNLPEYAIKCINKLDADKRISENKDDTEHIYVYPVRYYQDISGNIYKDYVLNTKQFQIVANKQQIAAVQSTGKIAVWRIPNQPVDYITKYEFTRYREIHDKIIKDTTISSFSYTEAVTAGCFEKDTYKKYPKVMISHRAFTYGARDIASDILFGIMETTELKQINNIDLDDADIIEIL